MDKTLNQRIYETPGDVKKVIHDFGYEEGKKAAAEEIYNELLDYGYPSAFGGWAVSMDSVRRVLRKYLDKED